MTTIDPGNVLGTGDITPPPGLKVETPEQKELYRASMEFERFFIQNMMKEMNNATKAMGADDKQEGTAGVSTYQDMASDQMVQALLDGGGIGLAATLYTQMGQQSGITSEAPTHIPTGISTPAASTGAAPAGGAA